MSFDLRATIRGQLHYTQLSGHKVGVWNHWLLYHDAKLTSAVLDALLNGFGGSLSEVDYLCAIPKSGLILGTLISQRMGLPLLTYWRGEGVYGADRIRSKARVALFDPDVRSGWSLQMALTNLEEVGAQVESLCAILYDDTYPEEYTIPIRDQWYRAGRIHALCTLTEILQGWGAAKRG